MGWNSWNYYSDQFDDKVVRSTADATVASNIVAHTSPLEATAVHNSCLRRSKTT